MELGKAREKGNGKASVLVPCSIKVACLVLRLSGPPRHAPVRGVYIPGRDRGVIPFRGVLCLTWLANDFRLPGLRRLRGHPNAWRRGEVKPGMAFGHGWPKMGWLAADRYVRHAWSPRDQSALQAPAVEHDVQIGRWRTAARGMLHAMMRTGEKSCIRNYCLHARDLRLHWQRVDACQQGFVPTGTFFHTWPRCFALSLPLFSYLWYRRL